LRRCNSGDLKYHLNICDSCYSVNFWKGRKPEGDRKRGNDGESKKRSILQPPRSNDDAESELAEVMEISRDLEQILANHAMEDALEQRRRDENLRKEKDGDGRLPERTEMRFERKSWLEKRRQRYFCCCLPRRKSKEKKNAGGSSNKKSTKTKEKKSAKEIELTATPAPTPPTHETVQRDVKDWQENSGVLNRKGESEEQFRLRKAEQTYLEQEEEIRKLDKISQDMLSVAYKHSKNIDRKKEIMALENPKADV
jgi:hypothetical protein